MQKQEVFNGTYRGKTISVVNLGDSYETRIVTEFNQIIANVYGHDLLHERVSVAIQLIDEHIEKSYISNKLKAAADKLVRETKCLANFLMQEDKDIFIDCQCSRGINTAIIGHEIITFEIKITEK